MSDSERPIQNDRGALQAAAESLMRYLSRHIVCLGVSFVYLDKNQKPKPEEHFMACSCFIMSINSMWFLVTAGHVFKDLDKWRREKHIEVTNSVLADYFGEGATVHLPTPFDIDHPKHRAYIDHRGLGLDLGLFWLRPLYRAGLEANNVIPISKENWVKQHEVEFDRFYLLGFSHEIVSQETKAVPLGQQLIATVPMTMIPVEPVFTRDELPSTVVIPDSELPWFVGRIVSPNAPNIKGMSGGPIVGMKFMPDKSIEYWFVALQSHWYEESRIIVACPVSLFAEVLSLALEENNMTEETMLEDDPEEKSSEKS